MKKWLSPIVFLGLLCGCSGEKAPADFDYGRVQDNKYVNSFFDFEMKVPADWVVQTQEQMENITKVGKEIAAGDDQRMKAILKASDVNTANLLGVYQYEYGAAVDFNPNIMLIAENISHAPGIKTGGDYLFQSRRLLMQSQFRYDHLDEKFEREQINGTDFYKMNASINHMGIEVRQTYYSAIVKGFSFNVIISYANDDQRKSLINLINSMTFNK